MNKKIQITVLFLILASLFLSLNPTFASVISSQYKKYKAKYKNSEDKADYFKMKDLRKDNNELFFFWKNLCETHKYDSDIQFETLPQKTQEMCRQYYSYKGYKKYVYWRNKHDDSDDDEETATAEAQFVCGTDTVEDADGNEYDTIEVGTQCWMAENMRVGTTLASADTLPSDNGEIERWCYDNEDSICETDGGLYSWNEAMQYSTTEGAQGICPTGWHIPTDAEQYALENFLKDEGQTCDASREDWDCSTAGTKMQSGGASNLEFPLAGSCDADDETFYHRTVDTFIWSSSKSDAFYAFYRYLDSGHTTVFRNGDFSLEEYGLSVRCLKD